MRGYTFDPALLVLKSEQSVPKSSVPVERRPAQEEVEGMKQSMQEDATSSKAPVQLNAVSTSNRIDGSTAWTIAGVLLLAIFVAALVDARARLTRLETLLFAMLSHQRK